MRAPIGAVIGLAIALVAACKDEPTPIAVLQETSAGTERQVGEGAFTVAAVGAKFFRGDAVRTADGTALLALGPNAALRVQPKSLIRFGARNGKSSIEVELGEATLEGTGGQYQLGIGAITLDGKSTIRITGGGDGDTTLELMFGSATLEQDGTAQAMAAGETYELGLGKITVVKPDARPPEVDAAIPDAAMPDAAAAAADTVSLVIAGKKATAQRPGETQWKPVPAGQAELPGGASLKLGARTTAKARRPGVTLEMATGSHLAIGGDPFLSLVAGKARATGEDGADGKVKLPGGSLVLDGGRSGVDIDIKRRETEIDVTRGEIDLVGRQGKVELRQGETAVLKADGSIRIMNAVPKHFDLRVEAGDDFTVHDPHPPTAVRFAFDCGGEGTVELSKDAGFRAPRVSGGTDGANLLVSPGSWRYRVRCDGGKNGGSGRVSVRRDSGSRQLPHGTPPTNTVDADGLKYKVYYQNLLPSVAFRWKKPVGTDYTLTLAKGADKKSLAATGNTVTVPGTDLDDGTYTYFFTNSVGARSPTSTLMITFDNAAPTAYIEEPKDGSAFAGQIQVKGATLPGWNASVEGVSMDVDRQGRFSVQISPPSGNAIAIRLSHSPGGVHYYLRRAR